jgi:exodeoxyribonuclease VII large subunit
VPVVSAVGHEIDVTLCDLVADVRALTPSQAGELVVPDGEQLQRQIAQWSARLRAGLASRAETARRRLMALADRTVFTQPLERIHRAAQRCDEWEHRLLQSMRHGAERHRARVTEMAGRLEAVSPLRVLARGYSLTTDDAGNLVVDATRVPIGAKLTTRVERGTIQSRVESVSKQAGLD